MVDEHVEKTGKAATAPLGHSEKIMGYLVLQGGAEFGGRMRDSDLRAVELAGGPEAVIRIVPAAAAPDQNHARAGKNGHNWFRSLGAGDVAVVPLVDRVSAEDPGTAAELRRSKLIYLLGGFPGYLADTLAATPAWEAMIGAFEHGAVLAGSSAGAMVLCRHLFDPQNQHVVTGLGLISDACLIPHHNRYGGEWVSALGKELPRATLIGIDEETGMISNGQPLPCRWTVYGRGVVTLHRNRDIEIYNHGQTFEF